jgi:hypothetical protein
MNSNQFIFAPSGNLTSYCGSRALAFNGSTGIQALESNTLSHPNNSFIHFELNTGCTGSGSVSFDVELQLADGSAETMGADLTSGAPWSIPGPPLCNPADNSNVCPSWVGLQPPLSIAANGAITWGWSTVGPVFFNKDSSVDYWGRPVWTRISLPAPPMTTRTRRYRLVAQRPFGLTTWAVRNLYIGTGCSPNCGGRGSCIGGVCVCDANAFAANGTCLLSPGAPNLIRESFNSEPSPTLWSSILGGLWGTYTGSVGRGMMFLGLDSRRIVTVDLDTRFAEFIQFTTTAAWATFGRDYVLAYSRDGMNWNAIGTSLALTVSVGTGQYVYVIPPQARALGVRFTWWQPVYATSTGTDRWVSCVWLVCVVQGCFVGVRGALWAVRGALWAVRGALWAVRGFMVRCCEGALTFTCCADRYRRWTIYT